MGEYLFLHIASPILQLDYATDFSEGLAVVQTANRYAYIDPTSSLT